MTKLVLALMWVGLLAGCASSTMPAPDDPSTAIHEEPVMSQGTHANPAVAATPAPHKLSLTETASAAK